MQTLPRTRITLIREEFSFVWPLRTFRLYFRFRRQKSIFGYDAGEKGIDARAKTLPMTNLDKIFVPHKLLESLN